MFAKLVPVVGVPFHCYPLGWLVSLTLAPPNTVAMTRSVSVANEAFRESTECRSNEMVLTVQKNLRYSNCWSIETMRTGGNQGVSEIHSERMCEAGCQNCIGFAVDYEWLLSRKRVVSFGWLSPEGSLLVFAKLGPLDLVSLTLRLTHTPNSTAVV